MCHGEPQATSKEIHRISKWIVILDYAIKNVLLYVFAIKIIVGDIIIHSNNLIFLAI